MNWSIFIPFGAVIALLVIMAIFLLNGKGAFLIAGYNTIRSAKKARYDEKALCRCTGWLLLGLSVCFVLIPLGVHFGLPWLGYTGMALTLAVTLGFIIYANTGRRFLKQEGEIIDNEPTTKTHPAVIIATTSIVAVALIGACALTFSGAKDPVVDVHDSGIEIKGIYGLDIAFSEISDISLLEQSISDIGVGARTNGYSGFGQALKGNFRFGGNGHALLFIQADSSPTIKIARKGGLPVYLSLRDGGATRALYDEIMERNGGAAP